MYARRVGSTALNSLRTTARAIMPIVEEFESLSEKLAKVTIECERLRAENERLRRTLADQRSDSRHHKSGSCRRSNCNR